MIDLLNFRADIAYGSADRPISLIYDDCNIANRTARPTLITLAPELGARIRRADQGLHYKTQAFRQSRPPIPAVIFVNIGLVRITHAGYPAVFDESRACGSPSTSEQHRAG